MSKLVVTLAPGADLERTTAIIRHLKGVVSIETATESTRVTPTLVVTRPAPSPASAPDEFDGFDSLD